MKNPGNKAPERPETGTIKGLMHYATDDEKNE